MSTERYEPVVGLSELEEDVENAAGTELEFKKSVNFFDG